jgi:hypothetical protein
VIAFYQAMGLRSKKLTLIHQDVDDLLQVGAHSILGRQKYFTVPILD